MDDPLAPSVLAPPWTTHPTQSAHWADAHALWLASRRSPSTRRAYRKALELLLDFALKAPWEITRPDIAAWIAAQQAAGLAPETIHQRLAAVSGFYTFVTRVYLLPDPSGREIPLHPYNPVVAVPRPRLAPYAKAAYLTPDQARLFLRAIPTHTLQGRRDYALFLSYLVTGRRNTEIRSLRWGDLEPGVWRSQTPEPTIQDRPLGRVLYRWSGKGTTRRDEFPLPAYRAILDYLTAAGRLPSIQPADFIFTAHTANITRLRPYFGPDSPPSALSARMVGRLVKKYARRAGLDPARITVHTLRHTAAMLRKEAGDSLENISALLAHASLTTTQIYLHSIEGRPDPAWQKVEALLGLPSTPHPSPPSSAGGGAGARPRLRTRFR